MYITDILLVRSLFIISHKAKSCGCGGGALDIYLLESPLSSLHIPVWAVMTFRCLFFLPLMCFFPPMTTKLWILAIWKILAAWDISHVVKARNFKKLQFRIKIISDSPNSIYCLFTFLLHEIMILMGTDPLTDEAGGGCREWDRCGTSASSVNWLDVIKRPFCFCDSGVEQKVHKDSFLWEPSASCWVWWLWSFPSRLLYKQYEDFLFPSLGWTLGSLVEESHEYYRGLTGHIVWSKIWILMHFYHGPVSERGGWYLIFCDLTLLYCLGLVMKLLTRWPKHPADHPVWQQWGARHKFVFV